MSTKQILKMENLEYSAENKYAQDGIRQLIQRAQGVLAESNALIVKKHRLFNFINE